MCRFCLRIYSEFTYLIHYEGLWIIFHVKKNTSKTIEMGKGKLNVPLFLLKFLNACQLQIVDIIVPIYI